MQLQPLLVHLHSQLQYNNFFNFHITFFNNQEDDWILSPSPSIKLMFRLLQIDASGIESLV